MNEDEATEATIPGICGVGEGTTLDASGEGTTEDTEDGGGVTNAGDGEVDGRSLMYVHGPC